MVVGLLCFLNFLGFSGFFSGFSWFFLVFLGKTKVILLTAQLLKRMWCAGEKLGIDGPFCLCGPKEPRRLKELTSEGFLKNTCLGDFLALFPSSLPVCGGSFLRIATAFKHHLVIIPVACDDFSPLRDAEIEGIPALWSAEQKHSLACFGSLGVFFFGRWNYSYFIGMLDVDVFLLFPDDLLRFAEVIR